MKKFDTSLYFITDSSNYTEQEFLNRVDEIICFNRLSEADFRKISGIIRIRHIVTIPHTPQVFVIFHVIKSISINCNRCK